MAPERLKIDVVNSAISFSLKKLGFLTVKGTFSGLGGSILFDEDEVENSSFNVSVNTSTIDTKNDNRDEHLGGEDFFYIKEFPAITFTSISVNHENGQYLATGRLTILETTKEISIPFTLKEGVFEGGFSLKRLSYGLGKKIPSFFVGNTVYVSIHCKTGH
ncbi:MAG: YceI family protein [Bacteroidota bacterium]